MNSKYSETSTTAISDHEANETISDLVRRHILDKNHTTTDEELRNAKIEFTEIDDLDTKKPNTTKSFNASTN